MLWCVVLMIVVAIPIHVNAKEPKRWRPGHYMLIPGKAKDPSKFCEEIAGEQKVRGLMVRFFWNDVEIGPNQFDWSAMDDVLDTCHDCKKLVFISLVERTFGGQSSVDRCLAPDYVKQIDEGTGCMATRGGGMPAFHKKQVTDKFIRFIKAIATRYDGHQAFGGIQLEESAPGLGTVTPPEDYTREAYAEQLKRIYRQGANSLERGVFIAGLNWLGGEIEGLVDEAVKLGVGIGGPDLCPASCTDGATDAQEYLVSKHYDYGPVMYQIQSPEMSGKQGYCSVGELSSEGKKLAMSHYFWIRMWEQDGSINWNDDILPAIRQGLGANYDCPEVFENGCSWK